MVAAYTHVATYIIYVCIFCSNIAPYQIIQPSTSDYVQIVSSTTKTLTLSCSLNVNIPANVTITSWLHNGRTVLSQTTIVDQSSSTVQLPGIF